MALSHITLQKNPIDVLPYVFNWAPFLHPNTDDTLASDVIVDATIVTNSDDLVAEPPFFTDTTVRAFVSGGVIGTDYSLICTIQTQSGITAVSERTISVVEVAR